MNNKAKLRIHVVAGIIVNSQDEVLIAKRPAHLDQGGLWEFPGGKLEPGESSAQALVRELHEELDLVAEAALRVTQITHEYPEKIVTLEFFEVSVWRGKPIGKEGQKISWVAKSQLEKFAFPAANEIVLRILKLSRIVLVTPIVKDQIKFIARLEQCLAAGISSIQLTRPDLPVAKYRSLAKSVYELCEKYRAQLVLNSSPEMLVDFPNAGLHLNPAHLMACTHRPVNNERIFTAECHNLDEINQAELLDVDGVLLSPNTAKQGHRATIAPGWEGLAKICRHSTRPVFAQGGLQPADFPSAIASGCYGMAVGTEFWDLPKLLSVEEIARGASLRLPSMTH